MLRNHLQVPVWATLLWLHVLLAVPILATLLPLLLFTLLYVLLGRA